MNGFFKGLGALGNISIVCDIDEVVALQTPRWCANIYNKLKDDKIFNEELIVNQLLLDPTIVLSRTEYYLSEWLKRDGIKEVSKENCQKILDVYNYDGDFYDKSLLTNLGGALPAFVNMKFVDKIYYVTKSEECPAWKSKLKFIDDLLYVEGKTEILRVPLDKSKDECIRENIPYEKVRLIIEDQPKNIYDMLDGCMSKNEHLTVMSPIYGYTIQADIDEERLNRYYNENKKINMYSNNRKEG